MVKLIVIITSALVLIILSGCYSQPAGVLIDFQSVQELENWLAADRTNEEVINLYCAERAEILVKSAEDDGYRLHIEALSNNELPKYYGYPISEAGHIAVTAIIGDRLYLIEPISDKVWPFGELIRGRVK